MKFGFALALALGMAGCVTRPTTPASTTQQPAPPALSNHKGPVVYGIPLGAPLALPECGKYAISRSTTYKIAVGSPCFQSFPVRPDPVSPADSGESVLIAFPPGAYPAEASPGSISAIIRAGRLEGFVVSTQGYQAQDMILDSLTQKYGKPTTLNRLPLMGGGSTLAGGLAADWNLPDLKIFFVGILGGATRGTLRIATPAGEEIHRQRLESLKSHRTPL